MSILNSSCLLWLILQLDSNVNTSFICAQAHISMDRGGANIMGGQGVNGSRKWLAAAEGAAMDRWRQRQQQGSWTLMHVPCWNAIWKKQGAYGLIAWRFIPHSRLYYPCSRPRRSFGWWGPRTTRLCFWELDGDLPERFCQHGFFFVFFFH